MKSCFLIVPQAFAKEHEGHIQGGDVLSFIKNKAGETCTSLTAINVHSELFAEIELTYKFKWLSPSDFPDSLF